MLDDPHHAVGPCQGPRPRRPVHVRQRRLPPLQGVRPLERPRLRVRGRHHRRAAPRQDDGVRSQRPAAVLRERHPRARRPSTSPLVDTIVSKDFDFSPTTKLADLVLPTADWSERDTVDEELFGNLVISTERAVEPPGEAPGRLEVLPRVGQAHQARGLAVGRRARDGALAAEGVLRYGPHLGRVRAGSVLSARRRQRFGRAGVQEVREGHDPPRRAAWLQHAHGPHRALVRRARAVRLRSAARLHRACRDSRVPARAGEGVPAHPGDGASACMRSSTRHGRTFPRSASCTLTRSCSSIPTTRRRRASSRAIG